jgi:integrase
MAHMELQNIKSIVEHVLIEIKKYGLKDSSIEIYGRYLKRLLLYFEENNEINYSSSIVERFVEQITKDFNNKAITKRYYNALKRGAYLVKDYAETGSMEWKVYSDTRKYNPNPYYIRNIEDTLYSSGLKTEFKYKLSCLLRKFCCFLENIDIHSFEQVTFHAVKQFIVSVKDTNSGSMNYILYSLRLLFDFLIENSVISKSINLEFFRVKNARKILVSAYSYEEIQRIIQEIDRNSTIGKRDYAIIMLTLNTGLRGIDVRKLKLQDIDWYENTLNIIQSKTGKSLKLPLKGCVCNALAEYILHARPKTTIQNIFVRNIAPFDALNYTTALDAIIRRYCIKAKISKEHLRSFHSLRRSVGTWMAEEEVPIHTISQILGHADMNSSKPYLSFNQKQMYACAMGFEDIPICGGVFV